MRDVTKGAIAGTLAALALMALKRTRVHDSYKAHKERKQDSRLLQSAPPAGTPLLVSLARGVAEHTGVYLGANRVAELRGDGALCAVSLTDFINGDEHDRLNPRTGTRIFACCDDASGKPLFSPEIVNAAEHFMATVKSTDYQLFNNNCHLFTASCVQGRMNSAQSPLTWFQKGTFSIKRLNQIIAKKLNANRDIAWIGVEHSFHNFAYDLTSEKIQRLQREGKDIC